MANTLRIKRRASGSPGAPSSLANAELAFNEVDDVLYYGEGTGGAGGTATTVVAIAGPGAFATLSTAQTFSGAKTFTGDVIVTTQVSSDSSTKAASTAFVKAQNYLTGNQSITYSGDASGSGTTSVTLTLASVGTAGTYTKVTTDAKGRVTAGTSRRDGHPDVDGCQDQRLRHPGSDQPPGSNDGAERVGLAEQPEDHQPGTANR